MPNLDFQVGLLFSCNSQFSLSLEKLRIASHYTFLCVLIHLMLFQARSSTVPELQGKLHDLGFQVGARILDLMFVRDRAAKRELKLLNALLMVKTTLWKTLFGKEADKLEHANDDERTYYIIEKG